MDQATDAPLILRDKDRQAVIEGCREHQLAVKEAGEPIPRKIPVRVHTEVHRVVSV
jgi:hypothetical protein